MPAKQNRKRPRWPYGIGVLVGFTMVALFLLGYRFIGRNSQAFGAVLVYTGLLLWPAYAALSVVLKLRTDTTDARWVGALIRSHVVVPVGSLLALLFIAAIYRLFGGV